MIRGFQEFTRRQFLKSASGGLATIFFNESLRERVASASEDSSGRATPDETVDQWLPTCCMMCGGATGMLVRVVGGRVEGVMPNDENPIGVCNVSQDYERERRRGAKLCPKGNAAVASLYDPDRVPAPLRRIGPRGSGKWEAISWEEAVKEVAGRLREVKERYGPESLFWCSEDASFINIQKDFCELYGSPNFSMHSNICDVSRKLGYKLVMGHDRPLGDLQNSKYIMLFGWNPLAATKWVHLPAIINRARELGAKLVVIDPVFTHTAAKADEWVPIRPGTDGVLALAMANVIVGEGLFERDFVREWTTGFEEFSRFVKGYSPKWAEKVTSVPRETIERLARELASTRPFVIDAWSGPGHHSNATQTIRAIASLPVLLGQIDRPGTLLFPERKGPKRRSLKLEKPLPPRVDGLGTKYPFGHGSGIYCEARDAMLTGKPYQLHAGVFVFQNFVMAVPNTSKNVEALKRLDFIVAVDTLLSETAELADIVIPGSHFFERYELIANWTTWPTLALRQPVVGTRIKGMPEYELVMALGRELGLKDKEGKGFEMSYEEYMDTELKLGIGMSLEELKGLPGAVWKSGQTRYEKHLEEVKAPEGAIIDEKAGIVRSKEGKTVGIKLREKIVRGFDTPSKKLEFFSKELKEKAFEPLPRYEEPEDSPTKKYPLYLVAWKQAEHTHGRTLNNAWLIDLKPDNPLWVNTETGKRLGLVEGEEVWMESPYGKARVKVHLTEGIHPEVVGLHHGYGHWALGKLAKGKGVNDGLFMPGKAERLSGEGITKEVGVRIYK
ncbi:MAG TPA: molybdopterin-dependent oxidoreductase [Candidatus Brocadiales bacterium]|nr:molybdopterin-dependent oxidoreductase [Candidatus Brocadiales bacterium]